MTDRRRKEQRTCRRVRLRGRNDKDWKRRIGLSDNSWYAIRNVSMQDQFEPTSIMKFLKNRIHDEGFHLETRIWMILPKVRFSTMLITIFKSKMPNPHSEALLLFTCI